MSNLKNAETKKALMTRGDTLVVAKATPESIRAIHTTSDQSCTTNKCMYSELCQQNKSIFSMKQSFMQCVYAKKNNY